jgi:hypothetical protein
VYRLLKSYDLITSPAFVVIKAAEEFRDKTTAPNQMWQTDFTYLKVTGWGWYYLSTVLDDFSRYIVGWKLCTNMGADDVSATLDIALAASGCGTVTVLHKPRLLSDNQQARTACCLWCAMPAATRSAAHFTCSGRSGRTGSRSSGGMAAACVCLRSGWRNPRSAGRGSGLSGCSSTTPS